MTDDSHNASRTDPPAGPALFLMGPTASGKTGLALALAREFHLEILNADSIQVYRELNIGAAKPTPEERAAVPHHLLDLTTISHPFSAGRYMKAAWEEIRACHARGIVPLLVGGTGLYFRAVEEGIADIPTIPADVLGQLEEEGRARGWPFLHQELTRVDPLWAARVSANDRQRILRGLSVFRATGRALSHWHRAQPTRPPLSLLKLGLFWDAPELYQRIDRRFDQMMTAGFLEEAREILAAGHDRDLPAMKAVGYRQLFTHLEGRATLAEAVAEGQRASRQYAKRQLTWLRAEASLHRLPGENPAPAHAWVQAFLQRNGVLNLAHGPE